MSVVLCCLIVAGAVVGVAWAVAWCTSSVRNGLAEQATRQNWDRCRTQDLHPRADHFRKIYLLADKLHGWACDCGGEGKCEPCKMLDEVEALREEVKPGRVCKHQWVSTWTASLPPTEIERHCGICGLAAALGKEGGR